MKKRLEDSNSELKSSQKGYSDLVRILHETRSEKDYLKNEMIPHLEKTLQLYQEYKKEQEAELEYYKFGMETPILRNHDEKKYRKSPQLSSRSTSRMSPGLKKYVQIKMPNSARTIIARSEHKNITKQRSSPVITTQRTRMDDLEFADSFPDEEELDGY